ncbi:MAG: ABC transporter ATP-binding protein [Clostridia bacterium]|nr:ABC transporter ATP-binding protein [Clostridia bacterium]NCC44671.1 ABC transporter ATP-binding protein [Clostridia bacterium]
MYIEVKDVSIRYEQKEELFQALDHVSLSIQKGEFICLLGPSGCGKTTLLNAMAGFEKASEGSINIDGQDVEQPDIKYVTIFQNYGLLPWRTVQKNVELGMEKRKVPKEQRRQLADHYIELVGLGKFKQSHPHQLSGGMQQRVAIARALAVEPEILFMDEPFGALDAITRMKLQDDVRRLSTEEKKTIVFVTHDIEEAVFLADRIVVMTPNPGKIKSIVNIQLGHDRDRTSDEFIMARDKIFEIFNMKSDRTMEYYI